MHLRRRHGCPPAATTPRRLTRPPALAVGRVERHTRGSGCGFSWAGDDMGELLSCEQLQISNNFVACDLWQAKATVGALEMWPPQRKNLGPMYLCETF
jgi:hypothetical protein